MYTLGSSYVQGHVQGGVPRFFWDESPMICHTKLYVAMDKSIFVEFRDRFTFFSDIK